MSLGIYLYAGKIIWNKRIWKAYILSLSEVFINNVFLSLNVAIVRQLQVPKRGLPDLVWICFLRLQETSSFPVVYSYTLDNYSLVTILFDTINDLFLNEMIKEPTRFRGSDTPSKLDWILTENADCTDNKIVSEPLGLSDHSLISIEYDCIVAKNPDDDTSYYSFFNGDYCAMRDELDRLGRSFRYMQ